MNILVSHVVKLIHPNLGLRFTHTLNLSLRFTQPNSSKLIHDTSTSFVLIDTQNTSLRCCGISSVLVSNLFGFEGMLSIMDKTDNNFGKAPVLLVPGVIIKIIKSQK